MCVCARACACVCVCVRVRVRVRVRVCGGARPPVVNQSLFRVTGSALVEIWLGVGVESGLLVVRLGGIVGRDLGRGWDRGEGNHHVRDGAGHTVGVPSGRGVETRGVVGVGGATGGAFTGSLGGGGGAGGDGGDDGGNGISVGEFPTCRCIKNQGHSFGLGLK